MMNNEIWKPVVGYEGLYEVSNLGNVKSLIYKEHLLKLNVCHNGYLIVLLNRKNKSKYCRVHRLVAQAFIPNLENKSQVNHINGNKTDNRVENLEWCTCKENIQHGIKTGLKVYKKGKENHMFGRKGNYANKSKRVSKYDLNDNFIETYCSLTEASKKNNINQSTISNVCRGRIKTAGGFKWKYDKGIGEDK